MIEYAKTILPKVCVWKNLFRKELKKCLNWLDPEESVELQKWCYENFYDLYPDIITEMCGPVKQLIKIPGKSIMQARSANNHFNFKMARYQLNTDS